MQPIQSDLDHLKWLNTANIHSFRGTRILDLGCGTGYICHKAIEDGAKAAIGIDIVKPAGLKDKSNGWEFTTLNLNEPGWEKSFSEPFDLILAFDIIEHLDSPYNFLTSCREAISSKGKLVLTTPNALSWERYYRPGDWSGVQDPQHKTLFTKYSLNFLLSRAGFAQSSQQAPMRRLSFMGPLQPQIGGQILSVATP